MNRRTKVPSIPSIPSRLDGQLRSVLQALKEALEIQVGHRGEDLDAAVTFRDLTDANMINLPSAHDFANRRITPTRAPGDYSTPPAPYNLVASGTFTNVLLSWEGGFMHPFVAATEVYRNTIDDLDSANHIGSTSSFIYTDTVEPGSTHYYWVRFRSPVNVPGPYNGTDGTPATTNLKVSDLLTDLNDAISQTHLSASLSSEIDTIAINGQGIIDGALATTNLTSVVSTQGDAITASANDITALQTSVTNTNTNVTANASGLSDLSTTVVSQGDDITATASDVTTLNTTVAGNSSSIQSNATTINGISAEQFVKIDVNGNVAGYGIYGSNVYNEFAVNAGVFKISNGASSVSPFTVISGAGLTTAEDGTLYSDTTEAWQLANHPTGRWFAPATYISSAMIADASIDVAKIHNLTVDMAQVTGSLTANHVGAGSITAQMLAADAINASVISVDNNIEFGGLASGLHFGKTSLGDSQAGAFFGRAGNVTGFSVSSANSGIYADSTGTVALNNVRLYTGAAGSAAEYTIPGTYTSNISAQSTSIFVIIVGGGCGASNNGGGGWYSFLQNPGNAGTASWIKWYSGLNGTGSVLGTYTAVGGAPQGVTVTANNGNYPGYAGQASSQAAGGAGAANGYSGAGSPGTLGSGGGGGGGSSYLANAGVTTYANAGATVSQLVAKPSNAQSVKMFVGTGGTGGAGHTMHYNNNSGNWTGFSVAAGASGGDGFVSIADPNSGGIEVDLLSIVNRLNAAGI